MGEEVKDTPKAATGASVESKGDDDEDEEVKESKPKSTTNKKETSEDDDEDEEVKESKSKSTTNKKETSEDDDDEDEEEKTASTGAAATGTAAAEEGKKNKKPSITSKDVLNGLTDDEALGKTSTFLTKRTEAASKLMKMKKVLGNTTEEQLHKTESELKEKSKEIEEEK